MHWLHTAEPTEDARRINAEYSEEAREPLFGLANHQKSMLGFIFLLAIAVICAVIIWLNLWWGYFANTTLYMVGMILSSVFAIRSWRHRNDPDPA